MYKLLSIALVVTFGLICHYMWVPTILTGIVLLYGNCTVFGFQAANLIALGLGMWCLAASIGCFSAQMSKTIAKSPLL